MTVTRADVAARAGTSTAVVSYVVNNGPRPVRPATRQRVLTAIEELGYRPNGIARALRTNRSRSLGLVVPGKRNAYYVDLTAAIENAARLRGHVVVTAHLTGDPERDAEYLQLLDGRGIDAFILIAEPVSAAAVDRFAGSVPRAHVLDPTDPDVDNHGAARAATEHLLGHGHTAVAFLGGPVGLVIGDARREGWRAALTAAGMGGGREHSADLTRLAGYRAGLDMLGGPDRPPALLTCNDEQAMGLMRAAWELGIRIPEDLALVGFDGTYDSEFTTPPLSSVSVPVGELATRIVDRVLDGAPAGAPADPLPFTLHLRESCGC